MRKLRFLAFAVISFVAALFGALLSPSTWLHKSLAVALCGVLSANPALCTNNAIAVHSQEASATNPVKVETTQFSDLLADRANDFGVDTPKSSPNNNPKPPSFPNEVSPNTPVRSPDFDNAIDRAAKDSAADVQRRSDAIDRAAKDSAADIQRRSNAIDRAAKDSAADVQRTNNAIDNAARNSASDVIAKPIRRDQCGREKCDFSTVGRSIQDQKCFGASGSQCESGLFKEDPRHPPNKNNDTCMVEMFVSEGSDKHDTCCILQPDGFMCGGSGNFTSELCRDFFVLAGKTSQGETKLFGPYNNPDYGKECNQTANKKTGSSYGDPHIVTFDGYRYSFQTVGEFTLVKSTDRNFEVQVRQSPVPGAQLSLNSAVAIKSGNSRIAIYGQSLPDSDNSTPIRVDGRPYPLQGGTLPNGTIIAQQGQGSYIIQTTSGEVVSVRKTSRNNLSYMDVNPSVPDVAGRYLGLLGNSNGNPKDDLQTRSGQVIETQSTYGQIAQTASSFIPGVGRIAGLVSKVENIVFDQLYKEFGNSWRISQADSLFDYKAGHTTDTFTDRGFPSSYRTLAMLSPAQVQTATAACQQANVNPEQLEGCIFDVGFTGDSGFAETASQALEIVNTINQLIPNAIPLPKLPISIPGLPF